MAGLFLNIIRGLSSIFKKVLLYDHVDLDQRRMLPTCERT